MGRTEAWASDWLLVLIYTSTTPKVAALAYLLPLLDGFQFGLPLLDAWD